MVQGGKTAGRVSTRAITFHGKEYKTWNAVEAAVKAARAAGGGGAPGPAALDAKLDTLCKDVKVVKDHILMARAPPRQQGQEQQEEAGGQQEDEGQQQELPPPELARAFALIMKAVPPPQKRARRE